MSRRNTEIWNHFDKCLGGEKRALCKYCKKTLSYKGTTTNLKTNLTLPAPAVSGQRAGNLANDGGAGAGVGSGVMVGCGGGGGGSVMTTSEICLIGGSTESNYHSPSNSAGTSSGREPPNKELKYLYTFFVTTYL